MLKKLFFILFIFILTFGSGSISGGFNTGKSNHDSAWVNDQTELLGGNVDINVDGKTTITGAVIAAVDENGLDNGNLNLATNELEYKDIKDFNTSSESGFGFSTSVGISTDKGKTNLHPSGSTTISMKDNGSESEQTTHATIGGGSITVGGRKLDDNDPALAGLNRDIDKSQEITRNEITGALDGSVTIDNRLLTSKGRAQIADQHENLDKNAIIAGVGAYGTVEGAAKFVGDAAGVNGPEYDKNGNLVETSSVDKWKANQSGMATGIRRGGDDSAQAIIKDMQNGETVSPDDLQKLAKMTSDGSVNKVYSNDGEAVSFFDKDGNYLGGGSRHGFNDLENKQGYVNLATGAGTDAYKFLSTDAEERAHNYVGVSETAAGNAANNEMSYYNTIAGLTGGYTVNQSSPVLPGTVTKSQHAYNQQYNGSTNTLLRNNNAQASLVKEENKAESLTTAIVIGGVIGGVIVGGLMIDKETANPAKAIDLTVKDFRQAAETLELNYPDTMNVVNGVVSLPVEVADQFLPLETAGLLVNTGLDIAGDGLNSIATDLSGNPNWLDENHLTRDAFDGVLVIGGVSTAAGGLGSKTGVVSKVDDVAKSAASKVDDVAKSAASKIDDVTAKTAKSNIKNNFEPKIEGQLTKRGWTKDSVNTTIEKPYKTEVAMDTRYNANGARNNAPATKYVNKDGSYVVKNDVTGDIVQISNKNKPGWIDHGTK